MLTVTYLIDVHASRFSPFTVRYRAACETESERALLRDMRDQGYAYDDDDWSYEVVSIDDDSWLD